MQAGKSLSRSVIVVRGFRPVVRLYPPLSLRFRFDGTWVRMGADELSAFAGDTYRPGDPVEKARARLAEWAGRHGLQGALARYREYVRRFHGFALPRGYSSIADIVYFTFFMRVPRTVTLFLCQSYFSSFLQVSHRYSEAPPRIHLPRGVSRGVRRIVERSYGLYRRLLSEGVSREEARYVLPLGVESGLTASMNAEELAHLWHLSRDGGVPQVVRRVLDRMVMLAGRRAPSLVGEVLKTPRWKFYPMGNVYSPEQFFEGGGLRVVDYSARGVERLAMAAREGAEPLLAVLREEVWALVEAKASLVALHQLIRHRTMEVVPGSLWKALGRMEFHVPRLPRGLGEEFLDTVGSLAEAAARYGWEGASLVPQALVIDLRMRINGYNMYRFFGERACRVAQPETFSLAWRLARLLRQVHPFFRTITHPKCVFLGYCPEPDERRRGCEYYRVPLASRSLGQFKPPLYERDIPPAEGGG